MNIIQLVHRAYVVRLGEKNGGLVPDPISMIIENNTG